MQVGGDEGLFMIESLIDSFIHSTDLFRTLIQSGTKQVTVNSETALSY